MAHVTLGHCSSLGEASGFRTLLRGPFDDRLNHQAIDPPDPGELYTRYREWLPFTHRITKFVEATAKNLGYDVGELSRDPDQVLFYEDL